MFMQCLFQSCPYSPQNRYLLLNVDGDALAAAAPQVDVVVLVCVHAPLADGAIVVVPAVSAGVCCGLGDGKVRLIISPHLN